jgi:hypothetical protein
MLATTLLNGPAPLLAWGLYAFAATYFAGPPLIGEVVDLGSHRAATSSNTTTSLFTLDAATAYISTTTSEVVELVTIVEISTRNAEPESITELSTSTTVPEIIAEPLTATPSFIRPIRTVTVTEIPQPVTIYADGTVATDTATPFDTLRDTPHDTPPALASETLLYMLAGYAIFSLSLFALRWLPLELRYTVAVCFGILGTAALAKASSPEIHRTYFEWFQAIEDGILSSPVTKRGLDMANSVVINPVQAIVYTAVAETQRELTSINTLAPLSTPCYKGFCAYFTGPSTCLAIAFLASLPAAVVVAFRKSHRGGRALIISMTMPATIDFVASLAAWANVEFCVANTVTFLFFFALFPEIIWAYRTGHILEWIPSRAANYVIPALAAIEDTLSRLWPYILTRTHPLALYTGILLISMGLSFVDRPTCDAFYSTVPWPMMFLLRKSSILQDWGRHEEDV